jgi:hypothetical protein
MPLDRLWFHTVACMYSLDTNCEHSVTTCLLSQLWEPQKESSHAVSHSGSTCPPAVEAPANQQPALNTPFRVSDTP